VCVSTLLLQLAARSRRRDFTSRLCGLADRLEEGDQLLGDGFGHQHWSKMAEARQWLTDVWVGDVLGDVALRV